MYEQRRVQLPSRLVTLAKLPIERTALLARRRHENIATVERINFQKL